MLSGTCKYDSAEKATMGVYLKGTRVRRVVPECVGKRQRTVREQCPGRPMVGRGLLLRTIKRTQVQTPGMKSVADHAVGPMESVFSDYRLIVERKSRVRVFCHKWVNSDSERVIHENNTGRHSTTPYSGNGRE